MGEGKRPTAELDRGELQRLATLSVRAPTDPGADELERDPLLAFGSDRAARAASREPRPTSKIDDHELVDLPSMADGTPAMTTDVVTLANNERKTARMRAKQFQSLLRGDARATLPITNELLQSIDWNADDDAMAPAVTASEPAAKAATRPPTIIKRSEPLSAKPTTKPPAAIVTPAAKPPVALEPTQPTKVAEANPVAAEPVEPEATERSKPITKPSAMIVEPTKRPMVSMRALAKPGEDAEGISDGAPIELTVVKSRPVVVPRPASPADQMRRCGSRAPWSRCC